MTKEQLMSMGLSEEQATKVMESLNGNFVTKTRFNEVNESNKQLKEDIKERDTQLEELKKVDAEGLQKKIEELQNTNKSNQEAYDSKIKQIQLDNAVEKALTGAKAKNIKAVKALLNLEKAELDGEVIKGLDEQLKTLQEGEDSKFLFDLKTESAKPQLRGVKPGEASNPAGSINQPSSLSEAVKSFFTSNE